ncbi:MAG TPA: competence/damage-inducible protein A [Bacteroidia bacterium]|nr:competence/damage-inducible protein A [Bacteroidia bacterium]
MIKAEIISIGDEILIGQITNTNAQWMAQQLTLIGISVSHLITVGDNKEDILKAFTDAQRRSGIILITGGLGPTSDDLTKPTLCEFFNTKLIFNEEVFEMVKKRFALFNVVMPESNRGQAEIPENCTVIKNKNGTAPGMWFDVNTSIFVSLPGVPYEMKAMMEEFVLPELKNRFQKEVIIHKTVYTQGLGESSLAEKIKSWEESLNSTNIKLAYLPSPSQVKLRLSVKGNNKQQLNLLVDEKISELRKLIPELIFAVEEYGKEPESLEKTIGELLRKKKQTLAVAESCTGGYIGHLITSIAGSSDYFNGGIIAYANDIKTNVLKVDVSTLQTNGAVSKEVAEQMASGVRQRLKADFGIATTGIAGPTGGSNEKPVGTVWIAVATPDALVSEKFSFGDSRERTIRRAGLSALNMLRTLLEFSQ